MTFSQFLVDNHDFDTLADLWNDFCSEEGDMGDFVYYSIEDLEEYFSSPLSMARAVFFGSLGNWGDRVYLNAYGNICSAWSIEHSPIDLDSLATWLEETNHSSFLAYLEEYAAEEDNE